MMENMIEALQIITNAKSKMIYLSPLYLIKSYFPIPFSLQHYSQLERSVNNFSVMHEDTNVVHTVCIHTLKYFSPY